MTLEKGEGTEPEDRSFVKYEIIPAQSPHSTQQNPLVSCQLNFVTSASTVKAVNRVVVGVRAGGEM